MHIIHTNQKKVLANPTKSVTETDYYLQHYSGNNN